MTEPVNPMTHCTHCRSPLDYDEIRNCKVCRTCHPVQKAQPAVVEKEDKRIDVIPDEKRVKEIIKEIVPDMIREELENWVSPATTEKKMTIGEGYVEEIILDRHVNWRSEAKELKIPLSQPTGGARKKVDVIKDIEKELSAVGSSD